jgi:hypothetical protein
MNVATLIYRFEFSVLAAAARVYLIALVGIAQTFCIEIAETTVQAGYDRADWFYRVWAIAHYSEMPETQSVDDVEPDYWFEPLEIVTPLHYLITAPPAFIRVLLPAPAIQVPPAKTKRSRKSSASRTQAPKSPKGRKSAGIAPRKAPTTVRSSTGALIPID